MKSRLSFTNSRSALLKSLSCFPPFWCVFASARALMRAAYFSLSFDTSPRYSVCGTGGREPGCRGEEGDMEEGGGQWARTSMSTSTGLESAACVCVSSTDVVPGIAFVDTMHMATRVATIGSNLIAVFMAALRSTLRCEGQRNVAARRARRRASARRSKLGGQLSVDEVDRARAKRRIRSTASGVAYISARVTTLVNFDSHSGSYVVEPRERVDLLAAVGGGGRRFLTSLLTPTTVEPDRQHAPRAVPLHTHHATHGRHANG